MSASPAVRPPDLRLATWPLEEARRCTNRATDQDNGWGKNHSTPEMESVVLLTGSQIKKWVGLQNSFHNQRHLA